MCRFLLAKARKPINPTPLLSDFAKMAKKSKAYDGDWQGDGWGCAWWNGRKWEQYLSLKPVWEDEDFFRYIPNTELFIIHARSASFEKHKNRIRFNQPFIKGKYVFVFNGLLKGVTLPYSLSGQIGSEKIWSLLQKYLEKYPTKEAFKKTVKELNKYAKYIQALNIGLSDGKNIYAYTQFAKHEEYYHLRHSHSKDVDIVCSEVMKGYEFEKMILKTVVNW